MVGPAPKKKSLHEKGLGFRCRVEKVGSVSFGATPVIHACNLAVWRGAVWSI
jgi:hypothetical protein